MKKVLLSFFFSLSLASQLSASQKVEFFTYDKDCDNIPPLRILFAEDEKVRQQMVKLHLSKTIIKTKVPIFIAVASDGAAALGEFADKLMNPGERYHLLITDLNMPELNGDKLAEEIYRTIELNKAVLGNYNISCLLQTTDPEKAKNTRRRAMSLSVEGSPKRTTSPKKYSLPAVLDESLLDDYHFSHGNAGHLSPSKRERSPSFADEKGSFQTTGNDSDLETDEMEECIPLFDLIVKKPNLEELINWVIKKATEYKIYIIK